MSSQMNTNSVNKSINQEVNTMKTLITLKQIIASVNTPVAIRSTAHFNACYDKAEGDWAKETRMGVPFRERSVFKLAASIKEGYRSGVAEFVAEVAYRLIQSRDIATFKAQIEHLVMWNGFCLDALVKCQLRMGYKDLHDLPLITIREGETWKQVEDAETLVRTLSDEVTTQNLLISNSGSLAMHLFSPIAELSKEFPKAWDVLHSGIVKKAKNNKKAGRFSLTDKIVLNESTMTAYMMPYVLNRLLAESIRQETIIESRIEYIESRKDAAIKEADGRAGEHRDIKVAGYSDLSKQEFGPTGYCNTHEVASGNVARYYEQGNAEFGIMGSNEYIEILEGIHQIENGIAELMEGALDATYAKAELQHTGNKPTYAWKLYGEDQFEPITDRDEAKAFNTARYEAFREELRKKRAVTKEDTARYIAMSVN